MNETLKKYIGSPEMYAKVEAIGETLGLHIDQVGELGSEIVMIMKGVVKKEDFQKHIIERLEVDETVADNIIELVNKDIFLPLRELMQQETPAEPSHPLETPDEILKHIEDAGQALPASDLTDHLLQNTVESKPIDETPTDVTPPPAPTPPPKKTYAVDPYREPLS